MSGNLSRLAVLGVLATVALALLLALACGGGGGNDADGGGDGGAFERSDEGAKEGGEAFVRAIYERDVDKALSYILPYKRASASNSILEAVWGICASNITLTRITGLEFKSYWPGTEVYFEASNGAFNWLVGFDDEEGRLWVDVEISNFTFGVPYRASDQFTEQEVRETCANSNDASSGGASEQLPDRSANELRIAGPDLLTLDPALAVDLASVSYVVEIFGGLMTLNPDLEIEAGLAEEIPTEENGGKRVNGDGTVSYTFRLREDAFFHDGRQVVAEDVKYSLERALDPATGSPAAPDVLGDIVGAEEKLQGAVGEVAGIEVLDNLSIKITIKQASLSFLYRMTHPVAFVVDQEQAEVLDDWSESPNGTGPYMVDEWTPHRQIVLKANPQYTLGPGKVDTIRYLLTDDPLGLYKGGEVDVAILRAADIEEVQDPNSPLNSEYHGPPVGNDEPIPFDAGSAPVNVLSKPTHLLVSASVGDFLAVPPIAPRLRFVALDR